MGFSWWTIILAIGCTLLDYVFLSHSRKNSNLLHSTGKEDAFYQEENIKIINPFENTNEIKKDIKVEECSEQTKINNASITSPPVKEIPVNSLTNEKIEEIRKWKILLDEEIITSEEFEQKKREILDL